MIRLKNRGLLQSADTSRDHRHALLAVLSLTAILVSQPSAAQDQSGTPGAPPLVLEKSIPIPNTPYWLWSDVLAVDVPGHRVFATPQGAKAVAVGDINTGCVVKMITGIGKLHGVYYIPKVNRLFVADGEAGELKVYSGSDYSLIKAVKLAVGADAIAYDPRTGLLYVGNGGDDAGMDHALVSIVDPAKLEKVADIAISSADLEGMTLDPERQMLYVNLVNNASIAVVDLRKRQQTATWQLPPGKHFPFASTLDSKSGRLYVTSRDDMEGLGIHGTLFALDSGDGHVTAALPIGGWADGVFVDDKRRRIYVTTGVGRIETFTIDPGDRYRALPATDSPLIAKHGFFSPELDRLFVDEPHTGRAGAEILIFKPLP